MSPSIPTPASTNTVEKPTYHLYCNGCRWQVPAPTRYDFAKAMVWAHQRTVAFGPQHAVVFVPTPMKSPSGF